LDKFLAALKNNNNNLHPIGTSIPKDLYEKFKIAAKIDGRSMRRIFADLINDFCDKILPKNYDDISKLLDK
jgi:hypothetical protein